MEGGYACSCHDNQSGDGETCTGFDEATAWQTYFRAVFEETTSRVSVNAEGEDLQDLFLRDVSANTTTVMSETPETLGAEGNVAHPAISDDARYVAFMTQLPLAENVSPNHFGIYRVAIGTADFELVGLEQGGEEPDPACELETVDSFDPALSRDGSHIAFASTGSGFTAPSHF